VASSCDRDSCQRADCSVYIGTVGRGAGKNGSWLVEEDAGSRSPTMRRSETPARDY